MTHIVIERQQDDLNKEEWRFLLNDRLPALILHNYSQLCRESKRHKFKTKAFYDMYSRRTSTLTVDDAPLPEDVISEAKQRLFEMVKVEK